MDFTSYIGTYYTPLKKVIQRNCWNKGIQFDEDIFHNTIEGCLKHNYIKTVEEHRAYFIQAYNTNVYREKQYAYNRCQPIDFDVESPVDVGSKIDLDLLYKRLTDKFGDELVKLFKMWLSGYNVWELEEHSGRIDLTYRFKQIKQYALQYKRE